MLYVSVLIITVFLMSLNTTDLFAYQDSEASVYFSPKQYVVYKIFDALSVDGIPDESAWQQTEWTDPFLDIQGNNLPAPRFETKAKMLWDENFLYIAAQLEEPHLWATLDQRDAIIFMENNFEIFIDPDGDTHNYYELEFNALENFWDLMLTKPYRNGGKPVHAWDIKGLLVGVDLQGTLNEPSDTDTGWTLEVAIPFNVLNETIGRNQPENGSQWKLNFSRVEWQTVVENGHYVKQIDPDTGKPFPEDNWVWSPQEVINMHLPERWGIVQFSEEPPGSNVSFSHSSDLKYEWILRELYYRQRDFRNKNGRYAETINDLEAYTLFEKSDIRPDLKIRVLDDSYIMGLTIEGLDHTFYIRDDSRAWKE